MIRHADHREYVAGTRVEQPSSNQVSYRFGV